MNRNVVAVLSGVLALLNIGLGFLSGWVGRATMDGTVPALVGSLATSAISYTYVGRAAESLVPAVLAAALGYYAVSHIDEPGAVGELGRVVAAGALGGVVLVGIGAIVVDSGTSSVSLLVVALLSTAVDGAVIVVAGALAGASLRRDSTDNGSTPVTGADPAASEATR